MGKKTGSAGRFGVRYGKTIRTKILEVEKKQRGTRIILHVNEESAEFLDAYKLKGILEKFCKFLPIPIYFKDQNAEVKKEDEKTEEIARLQQRIDSLEENMDVINPRNFAGIRRREQARFGILPVLILGLARNKDGMEQLGRQLARGMSILNSQDWMVHLCAQQ